jgi:hypothetical protein
MNPAAMKRGAITQVAVRWLLAAALVLIAGCAAVDPYAAPPIAQRLERDDQIGYCARLFADVDRRVDNLGVRDAETERIVGYPYLRTNRFTAALAERAKTPVLQRAWQDRLQQLDEAARATELENAALSVADLVQCRELFAAADTAAFTELSDRAGVPDNYNVALRILGLYPLTRLPFAAGIAEWHSDTRAVFSTPLHALPVRGSLQRYAPAQQDFKPVPTASRDALGVPAWSPAEIQALFVRHAPVLEIDVGGPFDRPGALILDRAERATVAVEEPVVYTRLGYAVIEGLIHPQLIYTFWFSERPSRSAFDLLSGKLDGLVWRATLDSAGDVLVYDSIHACGCYHLFFPTENVRAREQPETLDEGLFVPQMMQAPATNQRVVLRIESGTHYLQRVLLANASQSDAQKASVAYSLRDERTLTTLARRGGGTRSAYGQDGMVAGSERAERWFFWPMGIESAGQMRQWGHHATAFVGRRHFDDPVLFDAYFEVRR